MVNSALLIAEQIPSSCKHGVMVEGHTCYCLHDAGPTVCPIYEKYGVEGSKWNDSGDFNSKDWDGGCLYFENFKKRS